MGWGGGKRAFAPQAGLHLGLPWSEPFAVGVKVVLAEGSLNPNRMGLRSARRGGSWRTERWGGEHAGANLPKGELGIIAGAEGIGNAAKFRSNTNITFLSLR